MGFPLLATERSELKSRRLCAVDSVSGVWQASSSDFITTTAAATGTKSFAGKRLCLSGLLY